MQQDAEAITAVRLKALRAGQSVALTYAGLAWAASPQYPVLCSDVAASAHLGDLPGASALTVRFKHADRHVARELARSLFQVGQQTARTVLPRCVLHLGNAQYY
jgi:hypothetical protein